MRTGPTDHHPSDAKPGDIMAGQILARRLVHTAEELPAARLPADLWRHGRRRHRRRQAVVGVAAALLAVLVAVPVFGGLRADSRPVGDGGSAGTGAVPSRLYDPWPWQATVGQSPNGPAALLVSGGSLGYTSPDWPGMYGSKIGMVGRDGSYRMLRYGLMRMQASQDVLLSPDGRYVVGHVSLEDLLFLGGDRPELTLVDLVTGSSSSLKLPDLAARRQTPFPVAWSPDGRHLLLRGYAPPPAGSEPDAYLAGFDGPTEAPSSMGSLWLLDLTTGRTSHLLDLGTAIPRYAAFSPDGGAIVVQAGGALLRVETATGTSRTLAGLGTLGRFAQLAGAGAWRPDGNAIAVFSVADGCDRYCSNQARNQRRWQLGFIDATTGVALPATGFDRVRGASARIAGWRSDGTAVLVRYLDAEHHPGPSIDAPESFVAVRDVDLLALAPGGGTRSLIERPENTIWDIDVASDLVTAGAFGGPAPEPSMFPVASWVYLAGAVSLTLAGVAGSVLVLIIRTVRRRRREQRMVPPLPRAGPWPGLPASPAD